jgi:hypothetical protein
MSLKSNSVISQRVSLENSKYFSHNQAMVLKAEING